MPWAQAHLLLSVTSPAIPTPHCRGELQDPNTAFPFSPTSSSLWTQLCLEHLSHPSLVVTSCCITRVPFPHRPPRHRLSLSTAGTSFPSLASSPTTDFATRFGRICMGMSTVFLGSLSLVALPKQEVSRLGLQCGTPSETSWGLPLALALTSLGGGEQAGALCTVLAEPAPHLPTGLPKARLAAAEPPCLHTSRQPAGGLELAGTSSQVPRFRVLETL